MIKIKNKRVSSGLMFHYAHFICDCLFPEIVSDIFNYDEVVREKTIKQTIGNFNKIYTDVMRIKNTELHSHDFNNLNVPTMHYKNKEDYKDKIYFDKFRKFIFERYNINDLEYNNDYPEVLLIKRGERVNLIDDKYLSEKASKSTLPITITTGKERREIQGVTELEEFLKNKYKNKFKSLYFENVPFEEQVKYFNNAKIIVCAHGAVMANMFFCKENTKIVEVTCNKKWWYFDTISKTLNLHHIKCNKNCFINISNRIKILDENLPPIVVENLPPIVVEEAATANYDLNA